jgi:CheY-like chemotaxis protein
METKKLEVLVVEDAPHHQKAARQLLSDYNVDIVSTFDDAVDKLRNYGTRKSYDVVITDGFYPQGRGDMQYDKTTGKDIHFFGYALTMLAVNEGVPYVALVSDANHHAHPLAYTMDLVPRDPVTMNNSKVLFLNSCRAEHSDMKLYLTLDGSLRYEKDLPKVPEGTEEVKNYRSILGFLVEGKKTAPTQWNILMGPRNKEAEP